MGKSTCSWPSMCYNWNHCGKSLKPFVSSLESSLQFMSMAPLSSKSTNKYVLARIPILARLSLLPKFTYFAFCRRMGHAQLLGLLTQTWFQASFLSCVLFGWELEFIYFLLLLFLHFTSTTNHFLAPLPLLVLPSSPPRISLFWIHMVGHLCYFVLEWWPHRLPSSERTWITGHTVTNAPSFHLYQVRW